MWETLTEYWVLVALCIIAPIASIAVYVAAEKARAEREKLHRKRIEELEAEIKRLRQQCLSDLPEIYEQQLDAYREQDELVGYTTAGPKGNKTYIAQ